MENIKIIGLPVVVSARHRIVLDKNIRSLYQIEKGGAVLMNISQGFLKISPYSESVANAGEKKNISIGRFNLPESWAKENHINVGDFVYLVATDSGIVVCPKNLDFVCVGGLN